MKNIDILLQFIDFKQISKAELERSINVSNGYLNNTLKRGGDLSYKVIEKVKEVFPELSEFLNNKDVLDGNLNFISKLQGYEREMDIALIEHKLKEEEVYYKNQSLKFAPFLPIKAQAGYIHSYDQIQYLGELEKYAIPPGINTRGAEWMFFEIKGDSMEPVLSDGDIILCSMVNQLDWENVRNFYTYVLITDDNICCKRIFVKSPDTWVLISENEDLYPQKLFNVADLRQLWVYRRTFSSKIKPTKKFEIKI